ALLHDLARSEGLPSVYNGDGLAQFRQVESFLHRGVATADHDDIEAFEEEPVTRRTGTDPAAFQALLVRKAKVPRVGSRGDDDGPGFVGSVGSPHDEGTFREIDFRHVVIHEIRFESLRLLAPELHELGALDPAREPRIV